MTSIQWTNETWNPVTGCSKVSQGCKHCYAETIAKRFWGERKFTDVICHEDRLQIPLKWKRPRMVFVNSMSDLFHESVPFEFVAKVWAICAEARQHTFQILTKRPERMLAFCRWLAGADHTSIAEWPRNCWTGVSVESPLHFDRIAVLQGVPAAVRFISAEPLLNSVVPMPLHKIDWVICGGESGPGARPFDVNWAADLWQQCREAKVPFFMKQIGSKAHMGGIEIEYKDSKGGDPAEWPAYLRMREFPVLRGEKAQPQGEER